MRKETKGRLLQPSHKRDGDMRLPNEKKEIAAVKKGDFPNIILEAGAKKQNSFFSFVRFEDRRGGRLLKNKIQHPSALQATCTIVCSKQVLTTWNRPRLFASFFTVARQNLSRMLAGLAAVSGRGGIALTDGLMPLSSEP